MRIFRGIARGRTHKAMVLLVPQLAAWYHLGTGQKCRFSVLAADMMPQEFWAGAQKSVV